MDDFYSLRATDYDNDKVNAFDESSPIPQTIFRIIEHIKVLHDPQMCLDVGVGTGRVTIPLVQKLKLRVIGVDLNFEMLKLCQERSRQLKNFQQLMLLIGDAESLPFAPGLFNLIYSTSCFHLFNPKIVLGEWQRILSRDGIIVIGDVGLHPLDNENFHNRIARCIGPVIGQFFLPNQLVELVAKNGLHTVNQFTVPYKRYFEDLIQKKARYFSEASIVRFFDLIANAPDYLKEAYSIDHESITWHYTITICEG